MGLLLTLFLAGCKDQALIDENDKLKQRVADLERAGARLEKDNDALKAQLRSVQDSKKAEEDKQKLASLGFDPNKKLTATFVTSLGDIHCTLHPLEAPDTVANFVGLAKGEREWTDPDGHKVKRPLYDGTIFHRVIPEFMIQGGDPLGTGFGGPGYEFADEITPEMTFSKPGLLAMANAGPNTNGSQFFITDSTPTNLNGKHTIFGDCGDAAVVSAISHSPRDGTDKPNTPVVLKRVVIAN